MVRKQINRGTMTLPSTIIQAPPSQTTIEHSIIIVNYNTITYAERCIQSIIDYTDMTKTEIILVDNKSQEDNLENFIQRFPDIIVIQSSQNLGFGYGNNLGGQFANGKYLIFLNPDTIVTQNWLEALIKPLEQNLEIGLVTPKILLTSDPNLINACGHQVHFTGIVQCRGIKTSKEQYQIREEVSAVSGAAFAIRKTIFREINGFDSYFFLFIEDTEISWQAQLAGYRCVFTPHSVIYHDYALTFWQLKMFYYERNRYTLLLKTYKWGTLILLSPMLLLTEFIAWFFIITQHRELWHEKLDVYTWIIRNWHQIWRSRQRVQNMRRRNDRTLLKQSAYRLIFEQTLSKPFARLAHFIFDPIFFIYKAFLLALIHW